MDMNDKYGLSDRLGEKWDIDARIFNDPETGWCIHLFPSTNNPDMGYFIVYPYGYFDDIFNCNKMARISVFEPSYIICSDSTKNNWIMNAEEKMKLMNMLTDDVWREILNQYKFQLEVWDNFSCNLPEYISMPDYTKLPDQV